MSNRHNKGAIASVVGLLALVGLIVLSWDRLRDWYVGYRFIWLPAGVETMQYGRTINASGEVAVRLGEPQGAWTGRWSLATRDVLPLDVPLAGDAFSLGFAINDASDMVGTVAPVPWPSDNHTARPFLRTKDARVRDLPTLGGNQTVPTAINERGQVAGRSISPSNNVFRAFLWSAESGIADLGSLAPGKESRAIAINEAGWVVGHANAADGSVHPFLWKPETGMQDLGLPSGFSGGAAGHINDRGEVLVNFYNYTRTRGLSTPFVWREKDGFVKLPIPPSFDFVEGVTLNNRGSVLLEARPSDPSLKSIGYLIVNGVLKELPAAPGAKSTGYYGLNNKGWLGGVAEMKGKWTLPRGFVALPVR